MTSDEQYQLGGYNSFLAFGSLLVKYRGAIQLTFTFSLKTNNGLKSHRTSPPPSPHTLPHKLAIQHVYFPDPPPSALPLPPP